MIIDFHSHDFPQSIAGYAISSMARKTAGVLWPVGDGTIENHLDHMELAGVDKSVLCQIATKPAQWDVILQRSKAIISGEEGRRAQKKIIPFASVHPLDAMFGKHLEEIAAAGVKGVKFHPYYQDFSLADKTFWPMFGKIADLGLVVQCHCGGDICWSDLNAMCGPREIEKLVKNVRGLKFVAAHLGGCFGYEPHATDALRECGVYIDTAMLSSRRHYDEEVRILRSWPKERILFGTDFPWAHYAECIENVKLVREKADWEALFSGNAIKLLGD